MNRAAQITPSVIEAAPQPAAAGSDVDQRRHRDHAAQRDGPARSDRRDARSRCLKGVHVEVTPDGVLIEIVDQGNNLLFDTASSKLKEPLIAVPARSMGPILADTDAKIEINGHTDAAPFVKGAKISNWDLSYQRASASHDILVGARPRRQARSPACSLAARATPTSRPTRTRRRTAGSRSSSRSAKNGGAKTLDVKTADDADPASALKDKPRAGRGGKMTRHAPGNEPTRACSLDLDSRRLAAAHADPRGYRCGMPSSGSATDIQVASGDGMTAPRAAPLTIEGQRRVRARKKSRGCTRTPVASPRRSIAVRWARAVASRSNQARCACVAARVYFFAPYTLFGATVSGGGCHRIGEDDARVR